MDAVEIMREFGKMCSIESEYGCSGCGLSYEFNGTGEMCEKFIAENPEKAVEIVEKWAAEHPKKTRQSEFLKMFPSVHKTDGIIAILPCSLDIEFGSNNYCDTVSCYDCRKEYWNEEVE